jgi:hypothetical protein
MLSWIREKRSHVPNVANLVSAAGTCTSLGSTTPRFSSNSLLNANTECAVVCKTRTRISRLPRLILTIYPTIIGVLSHV